MSPDATSIMIRRARAEDASVLSAFAAQAFHETFGPYTPPADLAAHLASTYTPDREAMAIADLRNDILLAETLSSAGPTVLIGYVHVCQTTPPECIRGPAPIELKRLYIDTTWHGRGVAQQLMEEALRAALARGGQTLWLGVWEHNLRAQAFYRRYGFERVGEYVYMVGADAQIDWLMARALR